jgi:hypothetical protein
MNKQELQTITALLSVGLRAKIIEIAAPDYFTARIEADGDDRYDITLEGQSLPTEGLYVSYYQRGAEDDYETVYEGDSLVDLAAAVRAHRKQVAA